MARVLRCGLSGALSLSLSLPFSLVLLGACTDDTRLGPAVSVQKLDDGRGCYVACGPEAPLDPAIAAALGIAACPASGTGELDACSFEGGTDRIRVVADYGDLAFDSCLSVETPKVEVLLEDRGAVELPAPVPGCTGQTHYFAHETIAAPVSSSGSVQLRVSSGNGFFTDTPSFPLKRPDIDIEVERCIDEGGGILIDCGLVAGVDSTLVTVSVPALIEEDEAILSFTTGGESSGEASIALAPAGGSRKAGSIRLEVPGEAGHFLSINARVGELFSTYSPIRLVAPRPLALEVTRPGEVPDFTEPSVPTIAAGDPIDTCRRAIVSVLAPDGAPDGVLTLQTSMGTLDGTGQKIEKELTGSGSEQTATAVLDLPLDPGATRQVFLSASGGEALSGLLSFELAPVWPAQASLSVPKSLVSVGAAGSDPVTITGFALHPSAGGKFPSDTRLSVVVKAVKDGAAMLPCGVPVKETDLNCDPTKSGELPGGCLLAPKSVLVGPTGEIAITLGAGICFSGNVYVDVYAQQYTSTETCLGDRAVSAEQVRLTTGAVLALDYGG